MKKFSPKVITFVLIISMTFSLSACSSTKSDNVSSEISKYGQVAIDTCNDYLNHNIDTDDALNKINKAYYDADFALDKIKNTEEEGSNDHTIVSDILLLHSEITMQKYGESTYSDVEEQLKKLQDDLKK